MQRTARIKRDSAGFLAAVVETPCRTCVARCGAGSEPALRLPDYSGSFAAGDRVRVSISPKGLTRCTALVYGLPLLAVLVAVCADSAMANPDVGGVGWPLFLSRLLGGLMVTLVLFSMGALVLTPVRRIVRRFVANQLDVQVVTEDQVADVRDVAKLSMGLAMAQAPNRLVTKPI